MPGPNDGDTPMQQWSLSRYNEVSTIGVIVAIFNIIFIIVIIIIVIFVSIDLSSPLINEAMNVCSIVFKEWGRKVGRREAEGVGRGYPKHATSMKLFESVPIKNIVFVFENILQIKNTLYP